MIEFRFCYNLSVTKGAKCYGRFAENSAKSCWIDQCVIWEKVRWEFSALHLSAHQHDPYVKAYYQHLIDNGKLPLQAICAVMRKLLHAIHGMLKHDKPFDNTRFYAIPV